MYTVDSFTANWSESLTNANLGKQAVLSSSGSAQLDLTHGICVGDGGSFHGRALSELRCGGPVRTLLEEDQSICGGYLTGEDACEERKG